MAPGVCQQVWSDPKARKAIRVNQVWPVPTAQMVHKDLRVRLVRRDRLALTA